MAIKKDTYMDKVVDTILSLFDKLEKSMEKYPIIKRLLSILLVVGVICWIVWKIAVAFFAVIVWFVTATIEICLMPVHFLIWLFIGKFPMFNMHFFVLKKLKIHDICYAKD